MAMISSRPQVASPDVRQPYIPSPAPIYETTALSRPSICEFLISSLRRRPPRVATASGESKPRFPSEPEPPQGKRRAGKGHDRGVRGRCRGRDLCGRPSLLPFPPRPLRRPRAVLGRTCVGQPSIRGRFPRHRVPLEQTLQSSYDARRPVTGAWHRARLEVVCSRHTALSRLRHGLCACAWTGAPPMRSGRNGSFRFSMW
jgi:hypothetical protein